VAIEAGQVQREPATAVLDMRAGAVLDQELRSGQVAEAAGLVQRALAVRLVQIVQVEVLGAVEQLGQPLQVVPAHGVVQLAAAPVQASQVKHCECAVIYLGEFEKGEAVK